MLSWHGFGTGVEQKLRPKREFDPFRPAPPAGALRAHLGHRHFAVAVVVAAVVTTVVVAAGPLATFVAAPLLLITAAAFCLANDVAVRSMDRQRRLPSCLPLWRTAIGVALALIVTTCGVLIASDSRVRLTLAAEGDAAVAEAARTSPVAPLVVEHQRLIERADVIDRGSDLELAALRGELNDAQRQLDAANAGLPCEADGHCGSGRIGVGPIYKAKLDERDRLKAQRDELNGKLDTRAAALRAERATILGRLAAIDPEIAAERRDETAVRESFDHPTVARRLSAFPHAESGDFARSVIVPLTLFMLFLLVDLGVLKLLVGWAEGRADKPAAPGDGE